MDSQEPQTFNEALDAFFKATGYYRVMYWLLDRLVDGLNWAQNAARRLTKYR